jgi:hypothetical protein
VFVQGTDIAGTICDVSSRGPRIAVEDWWLKLARDLVGTYPGGLVVLGKELAELTGRPRPWSHTTLSNFATKKTGAARDLQEAICLRFRLPPPIFFPRTYAEAAQMLAVKELHDQRMPETPAEPATVHDINAKPHAQHKATAEKPHAHAHHPPHAKARGRH